MDTKDKVIALYEQLRPLLLACQMEVEQVKSYGLSNPVVFLIPRDLSDNTARAMGCVSGWLTGAFPEVKVVKVGLDISHSQAQTQPYDWKFEFTPEISETADLVNVVCLRGDYVAQLFKNTNSTALAQ